MLRIFYMDDGLFKFVNTESEACEIGICSACVDFEGKYCDIDDSIKSVNLYIFMSVDGQTINIIKDYESFLHECDEYYSQFYENDEHYSTFKKDNYIEVFLPDTDLGSFLYYENIQVK